MTYSEAKAIILRHLRMKGWSMSNPTLKIPHATSPDGKLRLWFKTQAVYFTEGDEHSFGNARTLSYDFDIRQYDGPTFLAQIERWFPDVAERGYGHRG